MTQPAQESGLAVRPGASAPDRLMHAPRCVGEMMTTNLVTMYPNSLFRDVVDVLAKNSLRHLLVVDSEGRLVGVISDRDVLRAADVMIIEPVTVAANTPLSAATALALDNRVNCLPVVDDSKQIRGIIITTTDLLRAFQKLQMSVEQLPTTSR